MQFIDHHDLPHSATIPLSLKPTSDAQEALRNIIANDILQISGPHLDENGDACALVKTESAVVSADIDIPNFYMAIVWMGMIRGVILHMTDIEKIINDLQEYALAHGETHEVPLNLYPECEIAEECE